jgi:sugar O-acyltransferase (sialic acid O-acetyltransferase NeuD family)
MTDAPLIILGAGGHGRVVADAALSSGRRVLSFVDEGSTMPEMHGVPVRRLDVAGALDLASQHDAELVVAIGDNRTRKKLQEELAAAGARLASVLHPSSVIASSATIGRGTVILACAVVGVDARIADGCIVNTGARVDHDGNIGAFSHLSPGATLGGQVSLGEGVHLAVGVSVRNRVHIGAWSIIGVGAAVVQDVPESVMAYGVPARVVRSLEPPS